MCFVGWAVGEGWTPRGSGMCAWNVCLECALLLLKCHQYCQEGIVNSLSHCPVEVSDEFQRHIQLVLFSKWTGIS